MQPQNWWIPQLHVFNWWSALDRSSENATCSGLPHQAALLPGVLGLPY